MSSAMILVFPLVLYLSLCALPRAAVSLFAIGVSFLVAQGVWWLGVSGRGDAGALAGLLTFVQIAIVMAGLVQGLRLTLLPADAGRGSYIALILGGALLAAAILRSAFGA